MPIDFENYSTYIFDMDGTMVDNMTYHVSAWQEFLRRHGAAPDAEELQARIAGKKNVDILTDAFGTGLTEEQIRDYTAEKEELYRNLYANDIKPVDGLLRLIEQAKRRGIKIAVATIAPAQNRSFILTKLGLTDMFDAIIGDEDVTRGKPDPEVYVVAADRLQVKPSDCIVFEDSIAGVAAARAAGMAVIGLATSYDTVPGANMMIDDFTVLLR